jgi:hypothetical protein
MTLEEYEQIVSNDLITAHNNKNMAVLIATFKKADHTLESNNISPADRQEFWEKVRKIVYSSQLRLERQANSALIVLMQALEREIAARTGKSK